MTDALGISNHSPYKPGVNAWRDFLRNEVTREELETLALNFLMTMSKEPLYTLDDDQKNGVVTLGAIKWTIARELIYRFNVNHGHGEFVTASPDVVFDTQKMYDSVHSTGYTKGYQEGYEDGRADRPSTD